jgi:hypothetical protein
VRKRQRGNPCRFYQEGFQPPLTFKRLIYRFGGVRMLVV